MTHPDPFHPKRPFVYECFDCGGRVSGEHHPGSCAICGGTVQDVSVTRE